MWSGGASNFDGYLRTTCALCGQSYRPGIDMHLCLTQCLGGSSRGASSIPTPSSINRCALCESLFEQKNDSVLCRSCYASQVRNNCPDCEKRQSNGCCSEPRTCSMDHFVKRKKHYPMPSPPPSHAHDSLDAIRYALDGIRVEELPTPPKSFKQRLKDEINGWLKSVREERKYKQKGERKWKLEI